jgi:hypothetical protein
MGRVINGRKPQNSYGISMNKYSYLRFFCAFRIIDCILKYVNSRGEHDDEAKEDQACTDRDLYAGSRNILSVHCFELYECQIKYQYAENRQSDGTADGLGKTAVGAENI